MPFQGLILIGQVLPKLGPFSAQTMTGHGAAAIYLPTNHRTRCCVGVADGERAPFSYRGVGVAMVNGSECHGKQRQGGKLDFNFDFN